MRIILTGYKGFIGSNLLQRLQKENYEVVTYEWGDEFPDIGYDDWVMHLGAISSTTETNVEKVMQQNVEYTNQLIELCASRGAHIQFASSASIYGLKEEFKEDSPVDPRTPYAWSKYMSERHALKFIPWMENQDQCLQIFRYFNVYGSGEKHKGSQASPFHQFEKQAKEIGIIKVFENSENYHRDFIHVDEVIDYHLAFMKIKKSGIFNIGTGKTKSFLDVAHLTIQKHSAIIQTIAMPDNLKHSYQKYTCADMTKTLQALS